MRIIIPIIFFLFVGLGVFAQTNSKTEDVDEKKELLFFSNNGCGKCSISQSYFDQHQMPYQKMAIKENRPLMYEYIHKKTGGKNVGIGYPVLVYGDSIYFSIQNLNAVLKEIEEMMKQDELLKENEEK